MNSITLPCCIAGTFVITGSLGLYASYASNKENFKAIYNYSKHNIIYNDELKNKTSNMMFNLILYMNMKNAYEEAGEIGSKLTTFATTQGASQVIETGTKILLTTITAPIYKDPVYIDKANDHIYKQIEKYVTPSEQVNEKVGSYIWSWLKKPALGIANPLIKGRALNITNENPDNANNIAELVAVYTEIDMPCIYRTYPSKNLYEVIANFCFNLISVFMQLAGKIIGKIEKKYAFDEEYFISQTFTKVFNGLDIKVPAKDRSYPKNYRLIAKTLGLRNLTSEKYDTNFSHVVRGIERTANQINKMSSWLKPFTKVFS